MRSSYKIVSYTLISTLLIPFRLSVPDKMATTSVYASSNVTVIEDVSCTERINRYKKIIKAEVADNELDWQLIIAMIKQESRFDENAVSNKGAMGLMQVMPVTQLEFADSLIDTFHPEINIKIGINYFVKLYNLFKSIPEGDRLKITLAAYNAGPSRIYDAQDIAAYMGENPYSWQVIQNTLPLLSKRYYTLHKLVWNDEKPRNGYFGGWGQTILYVQNVLKFREELLRQ